MLYHKRGWTISAIARHAGHDRKTIRSYLNGTSTPGVRKRPEVDPFDLFLAYVTARLIDDPHLWARTLCDELEDLGYAMSYQTLTRQIRDRKLRPACPACLTATERPNAVIDHPPYGNAMGLGGPAEPAGGLGMGVHGASIRWHPGLLGQVARRTGARYDPTPAWSPD